MKLSLPSSGPVVVYGWRALCIEVMLIALVVMGCKDSSTAQDVQQTKVMDRQLRAGPEEGSKKAPATQVSVKALIDAYTKDEVAAAKRYKGKTIEIEGVLDRVMVDMMERPVAVFKLATSEMEVHCFLTSSAHKALTPKRTKQTRPQQVRLKAQVDGLSLHLELRSCDVLAP